MKKFLQHFGSEVNGVISGWDRIAFRGSIRWLASIPGLATYLLTHHILLKDFGDWALSLTNRIRQASDLVAQSLGVRCEYLRSSSIDKDALARQIAQREHIETGPICMFSVVEPSLSPTVAGSRDSKKLEIYMRPRKCVWIYFYFNDANVGFGHVRLQTWLPFTIKGCLNGRHWLERSMMAESLGYIKHDNCFRWIADPVRAQQMLDEQLCTDWPLLLEGFVSQFFPVLRTLFGAAPLSYYWSADETELATDLMFRSTQCLDRLFPMFARHALIVSDSASVMRYLGRIAPDAALPPKVAGDVRGDRKRRHEGLCVKHRNGRNSVKSYNKAGNVLRVETTINNTRAFKVFRESTQPPDARGSWMPMRKGVADMQRRACISRASNERYLDALAACASEQTVLETIEGVCGKTRRNDRPVRALNPYSSEDFHLLQFLSQGQWSINGLRNKDLALWIEPKAGQLDKKERARLSSRASRLLGIFRAHGLINKVPRTHRYTITQKGHEIAALTTCASSIQVKTLMEIAA